MIRSFVLVLVGGVVVTCHGAEQRVMPGTLSPDKKVAILQETNDSGRDYYFVQMPGKKKLGHVLPEDQREISNVEFVASWNADSSKVALLVFYGTKLNTLVLDARSTSGQFQPVELQAPNALEVYKQRTHRAIPQPGDGFSNNGVGLWLDNNTVCLVSGEAKQTQESSDNYIHVYVTFKAHVQGDHAAVSDLELKGPLSDEASEKFEKKWGTRYLRG